MSDDGEELVEAEGDADPPDPPEGEDGEATKESKKKDKSKSKAKKKGKKGSEPEAEPVLTFAPREDERAMAGIKRAKGFGGLAGFGLTALASYMHGELMASVLVRALAGGVIGYLVAWLAAVTIWRRIIRAELHHNYELMTRSRQAAAQAETQ
ncbi:MAG TPA: hypothetical protein VH063_19250 [Gaiellaceae bacterium]|jgi:hypothetical protein|nr:hypothetical protein [Gaiellaceae bacterium]